MTQTLPIPHATENLALTAGPSPLAAGRDQVRPKAKESCLVGAAECWAVALIVCGVVVMFALFISYALLWRRRKRDLASRDRVAVGQLDPIHSLDGAENGELNTTNIFTTPCDSVRVYSLSLRTMERSGNPDGARPENDGVEKKAPRPRRESEWTVGSQSSYDWDD